MTGGENGREAQALAFMAQVCQDQANALAQSGQKAAAVALATMVRESLVMLEAALQSAEAGGDA